MKSTLVTAQQSLHAHRNKPKLTIIIVIFISLFIGSCIVVVWYKRRKHMEYGMDTPNKDLDYVQLIELDDDETPQRKDSSSADSLWDTGIVTQNELTTAGEDDVELMDCNDDTTMTLEGVHNDVQSDAHSDKEMDLIPAEKNTANNFKQILGDNCAGTDLVMDDIVNAMETDK
eukprot:531663_1